MCGIYGVWGEQFRDAQRNLTCLDLMRSRGPDGYGYESIEGDEIFFGHRRLAIIDLSDGGTQPMRSSTGRYLITFNGEIYNHLELLDRVKVHNQNFVQRGHSDTEALLEHIDIFGLEDTLCYARGMFALGLFDIKQKTLSLARDRMGEKPLYFLNQDNSLLFASELKSIVAREDRQLSISQPSLHWLFKQSCIPSPYSIYSEISKVMPGEIITFNEKGKFFESKKYWDIHKIAASKPVRKYETDQDIILTAEKLINEAVQEQMSSDVPLGAFLSGGVDSSLIVSLMQKNATKPIETFSLGFGGIGDETERAKLISSHLGTNHHTLICTPEDLLDEVDNLANIYCEPFADSSQIPTMLLTRLVSKHVTVCLSGDAGDELFGGYSRYLAAPIFAKKLLRLPLPLRRAFASILSALPTSTLVSLMHQFERALPDNMKQSDYGGKIEKIISILPIKSQENYFQELTHHWRASEILQKTSLKTEQEMNHFYSPYKNFIPDMMFNDLINYLESDILTKVDRAAMSNSLETRVPFLDQRVVEFALSLPLEFKIRNGVSKWILKEVLYKNVPKNLLDQPKTGFGIPIGHWLRGGLRDWADNLLSEESLKKSDFLKSQNVRKKFELHIKGKQNNEHQLWDVLMFQLWYFNHNKSI